MQLSRLANFSCLGLVAAAACAGAADEERRPTHEAATLAAEAASDTLSAALAAYADAHPCDEEGTCWLNPRPNGAGWYGITGTSGQDVWLMGGRSPLHFDGSAVRAAPAGMSGFGSTWAVAPNDVWAVNGRQIGRWDGTAFNVVRATQSDSYRVVWASGSNDVYVGGHDDLLHWDGNAWHVLEGMRALNITGTSADDVWVGYWKLWHFDGTSWSTLPLPEGAPMPISSLSVTGPRDAWMVSGVNGSQGEVFHFDGGRWVLHELGTKEVIREVKALAEDDVWAFGRSLFHFDGSTWTRAPETPTGILAVARIGGTTYALGSGGRILRLTQSPVGFVELTHGFAAELKTTWGSSGRAMWAVGARGVALYYDGERVTKVDTGVTANLAALRGTAADDVWAVGARGTVLHWAGDGWSSIPSGTLENLSIVFTKTRDDAWIGGGNVLLRASKAGITQVPIAGLPERVSIVDIDGTSPDDVWLIANSADRVGFVTHFDGKAWSPVVRLMQDPWRSLSGLYVRGPNDVWIDTPTSRSFISNYVWHWDGTRWEFLPQRLPNDVQSVERSTFDWSPGFSVDGKAWSVDWNGNWYYRAKK